MDPLTMGLITGGANLLGSIFSSQTNAQNTQAQIAAQEQMQGQTEQFNAQQADINRSFQAQQVQQAEDYSTQMSSTAYQRASQDMKSAGLNPMMMFGSGGPSSTPASPTASGSSASVGTPSVPMPQRSNPFAGIGSAVSSAVDSMVKSKQIDYLTSQVANTNVKTDIAAAGDLPSARVQGITANYVKNFMENHPDIAQAMSVGPAVGQAVDKTAAPVFDALSSSFGGLGRLGRALFGMDNSAKSVSRAAGSDGAPIGATPAPAASSSATAVRRGMDLERALQEKAAAMRDARGGYSDDNFGFVGEGR